MTKRVRTAVVGLGYFGSFHARHYAGNPDCDLVGVVDADNERANHAAQAHGAEVFADVAALMGKVDAVSVAAPTSAHFDVAAACLECGFDVFVEKPVAETVAQADELVSIAARNGRILQVGHIERFSRAYAELRAHVSTPLFVEARRIVPFRPRANDVSVVADLMIHDIDLVIDLIRSPVESVSVSGAALVNPGADHVTAHLTFGNGAAAVLTAGRVGPDAERTLRVVEGDRVVLCDLGESTVSVSSANGLVKEQGEGAVSSRTISVDRHDNLGQQIASFLHCCKTREAPAVPGETGREALYIVERIETALATAGRGMAAKESSRAAS